MNKNLLFADDTTKAALLDLSDRGVFKLNSGRLEAFAIIRGKTRDEDKIIAREIDLNTDQFKTKENEDTRFTPEDIQKLNDTLTSLKQVVNPFNPFNDAEEISPNVEKKVTYIEPTLDNPFPMARLESTNKFLSDFQEKDVRLSNISDKDALWNYISRKYVFDERTSAVVERKGMEINEKNLIYGERNLEKRDLDLDLIYKTVSPAREVKSDVASQPPEKPEAVRARANTVFENVQKDPGPSSNVVTPQKPTLADVAKNPELAKGIPKAPPVQHKTFVEPTYVAEFPQISDNADAFKDITLLKAQGVLFASDEVANGIREIREQRKLERFESNAGNSNQLLADFAVNKSTGKIEMKPASESVGMSRTLDLQTQRPLMATDIEKINEFFNPQKKAAPVAASPAGMEISVLQFESALKNVNEAVKVLGQFAAATKIDEKSSEALSAVFQKHRGNKDFIATVGKEPNLQTLVFNVAKENPNAALKIFKGKELMTAAKIGPKEQGEIISAHINNSQKDEKGHTFLDRLTTTRVLGTNINIDFKAVADSSDGMRFKMLTTPKLAERLGKDDFIKLLVKDMSDGKRDQYIRAMDTNPNFSSYIANQADKGMLCAQFLKAVHMIEHNEEDKGNKLLNAVKAKKFELAHTYAEQKEKTQEKNESFTQDYKNLKNHMSLIEGYLSKGNAMSPIDRKSFNQEVKNFHELSSRMKAEYHPSSFKVMERITKNIAEIEKNPMVAEAIKAPSPAVATLKNK